MSTPCCVDPNAPPARCATTNPVNYRWRYISWISMPILSIDLLSIPPRVTEKSHTYNPKVFELCFRHHIPLPTNQKNILSRCNSRPSHCHSFCSSPPHPRRCRLHSIPKYRPPSSPSAGKPSSAASTALRTSRTSCTSSRHSGSDSTMGRCCETLRARWSRRSRRRARLSGRCWRRCWGIGRRRWRSRTVPRRLLRGSFWDKATSRGWWNGFLCSSLSFLSCFSFLGGGRSMVRLCIGVMGFSFGNL